MNLNLWKLTLSLPAVLGALACDTNGAFLSQVGEVEILVHAQYGELSLVPRGENFILEAGTTATLNGVELTAITLGHRDEPLDCSETGCGAYTWPHWKLPKELPEGDVTFEISDHTKTLRATFASPFAKRKLTWSQPADGALIRGGAASMAWTPAMDTIVDEYDYVSFVWPGGKHPFPSARAEVQGNLVSFQVPLELESGQASALEYSATVSSPALECEGALQCQSFGYYQASVPITVK